VARNLTGLALLLEATNRFSEAEPLVRRALAIDESLGPDDPNVASDLNNLAGLLQYTDRYAEAEPLARRALAIQAKNLGPDHPDGSGSTSAAKSGSRASCRAIPEPQRRGLIILKWNSS
jgi:tetratricopeptide (TPR) repeat protein